MTDECQKSCGCASERKAESMTGATPTGTGRMSLFSVPKMDCPSEERMIRLALENTSGLAALEFDLGKRELRVFHDGPVEPIASKLESLGLGARLIASTESNGPHTVDGQSDSQPSSEQESRALKWLLAINAAMFVVEVTTGWIAQSTGLMADSLDMFADAAVYGLALYAVGRHTGHQLKAARLSGWLQLLLALGAMSEVLRRFVFGSEPEPPLMMGIALVALIANVTCLVLISSLRNGGALMKASWIFSTIDVLAERGIGVGAGERGRGVGRLDSIALPRFGDWLAHRAAGIERCAAHPAPRCLKQRARDMPPRQYQRLNSRPGISRCAAQSNGKARRIRRSSTSPTAFSTTHASTMSGASRVSCAIRLACPRSMLSAAAISVMEGHARPDLGRVCAVHR